MTWLQDHVCFMSASSTCLSVSQCCNRTAIPEQTWYAVFYDAVMGCLRCLGVMASDLDSEQAPQLLQV